MGYCVDISLNNVFITKPYVQPCLKAINELCKNTLPGQFSWVDSPPKDGWKDLVLAFKEWRYFCLRIGGCILLASFEGSKWGDDEILYETIAPFVSEDCFIECIGEDGCKWKYLFLSGEVVKKNFEEKFATLD
ncbi:MAG: hypothetical protein ACOCUH_03715 [Bacteriovoracia bacterium]